MNRNVTGALLLTLMIGLGGPTKDANACSCMYSNIASSYGMASDVVAARVVWGVAIGSTQWYVARVRLPFKGCLTKGDWFYIKTGTSGAACGVKLNIGHTYVLNGNSIKEAFGVPVLQIGLCLTQKSVGSLTKAERKWLLQREVCCGEECLCANGKPPVSCFADPCSVAEACPSGECVSNYCGGCNAEFYDASGFQVCNPCDTDKDCIFEQTCVDGTCQAGCSSDGDCPPDSWCSPSKEDADQCKPYQKEGDYCGGFTPEWAQNKCAPDLICSDIPKLLPDAAGTCRKPCKGNKDCKKDQYCGSGDVCRDDGSCWVEDDCEVEDNAYATILCVGYGTCGEDKTCDWICGDKELNWYSTCGNPVCGPDDEPPEGTPPCDSGEALGEGCTEEGATCDAKLGCGAALICATSDPKSSPEGCPKSKREYKNEINYLGDKEMKALYQEVLGMKLASWFYKGGPKTAGPRIGFLIDDNPSSSSVASDGQQVDLYSYATMAMAALKMQAKEIEALKQELSALKAELRASAPTKR